ncbi:hypothetical protein V7S43_018959 [Phytophthora oleae]|uniref:Uncharacterized protein n=1 Tax=Phytophthora oleae TaxID=2107226 RepID=A0ABD3EP70_9STRA
MFQSRIQELYFHERDNLDPMVLSYPDDLVDCMKENAQAFWERTHWVTMDPEADDKSAELYKERNLRRNALVRQYRRLLRKVQKYKAFPSSLLSEPGIWVIPEKCCPWIWQDPRVTKLGGPKCSSLKRQLETVDLTEPARTQWSTVDSDEVWMEFVPEDVKSTPLNPSERSVNSGSQKY